MSDGNRITTTVTILQLIIQLVICPQAIVNDGICIRTEEHLAPNMEISRVALVVKNLPANAGHIRDAGSIPGSARSPGGGRGNPLQHSSLGNPMDRGAWWATVHRVTELDTSEQLSTPSVDKTEGQFT